MERMIFRPHSRHMQYPGIRIVSFGSPFDWLREGLGDLRRCWPISLLYGVVFAALGYFLVSYAWTQTHLAMALTSGFLLLAPFLALGFHDLSRQLDQGMRPNLRHTFTAWRENGGSIGLYGALLMIALIGWERLSAILVALFMSGNPPEVENLFSEVIASGEHTAFLIAYALFGALLAAVVFALSVVSLPMLLDRRVDAGTAMMTSLWTVRENPWAMLLWAAIIVALIVVGYLTWFIGLAFIFPLLGHASWRAYRELIEPAA